MLLRLLKPLRELSWSLRGAMQYPWDGSIVPSKKLPSSHHSFITEVEEELQIPGILFKSQLHLIVLFLVHALCLSSHSNFVQLRLDF